MISIDRKEIEFTRFPDGTSQVIGLESIEGDSVDDEERAIFKDPITDDGTKKSAKGRVQVFDYEGSITFVDSSNKETNEVFVIVKKYLLQTIYKDGKMVRETTLAEIRARLK